MSGDGRRVFLRRTVSPYLGQIVILVLVTGFSFVIAARTHEWKFLFAVAAIWLLFSGLVFAALKYRISWGTDGICQEASGGRVCVAYEDITRVVSEVARPTEYASAARPFRRIAIYAEGTAGSDRFIDVSLKHFAPADIRELMQAIRKRRPDLPLPNAWGK